jgi:hypothetical protein
MPVAVLVALVVAVIALALVILGNLQTSHFENPYARWAARSQWNPIKAAAAFVALSLVGSLLTRIYPAGDSDLRELSRAFIVSRSFEQRTAAEQSKINTIRIGMTEGEVLERLGKPTGRFRAPDNPYGIKVELVFVSEYSITQTLLGEAGSIEYFAVTSTDYAFKLVTPLIYEYTRDGKPAKRFVLNETPIGVVDSSNATLTGGIGASWMNFGIVWGGSHADNWRHSVVGLHYRGHETVRGLRVDYASWPDSGNERSLHAALIEARLPGSSTPVDAIEERAKRVTACSSELSALNLNRNAPEVARWVREACSSHKMVSSEQTTRIRSVPAWQDFRMTGTANTFATTAPDLFDLYPEQVFYAIWDLGPREQSLP